MKRKSCISCANSTTTFGFIIGATLWVASALVTILLGTKEDVQSSHLYFYTFLASSLLWALAISCYMNMTAYYLDQRMEDFVRSQATFSKEDLAPMLRPYNSPFAYSVAVLIMGALAYALGQICTPSIALSPRSHASLHIPIFLYAFFAMLGLAFTFIRYKVIKRLLGLLPSVDAWKDKDACLQMETDLEHDDLIWQIRLFKPKWSSRTATS